MKCDICGREVEQTLYAGGCFCSHDCWLKNFWNETLDEEAIVVNGRCYHIGSSTDNPKGFDGGRFVIEMHDGRVIDTDSLCFNGEVPEEFGASDNARFIQPCERRPG